MDSSPGFLLLVILSCSYCCFCIVPEDPLSSCVLGSYGYDKQAYPTNFGMIEDEETETASDFASQLLDDEDGYFGSERFDLVGNPQSTPKIVSVDDFGAKGDGTDDTKAFEEAWEEACSSVHAVLVVPEKTYLVKPLTFSGPCKSTLTMKIYGTIEAPADRSDWDGLNRRHWLLFQKIHNLRVEGGGTIHGNGKIWWENSCKTNKSNPCSEAPTAITFDSCKNLRVKNLRLKDSQQMHLSFQKCVNVEAYNLMITAPGTSPNTDGIHVTGSQNVKISNAVIKTGDDCISIVSGSQNIKAIDITCGPGHGISIGSLGAGKSKAEVSTVTVNGAYFHGTTNGVRIKTWQGGSGYAKSIVFQNISMDNVSNPIIIDQNYCDSKKPCPEQESAVQVSDVLYQNIRGTSASEMALKFDCSKSFPCTGIDLQDINLVRESGNTPTTFCKNVEGTSQGSISPPACF